MKCLIHDCETETNGWYGQVASPYCPDNYVVEDAWETVTLGGKIEISERTDRRYNSLEEWKGNWSVDFSGIDIYVALQSQREIAARTGIPKSTVQQILAGDTRT